MSKLVTKIAFMNLRDALNRRVSVKYAYLEHIGWTKHWVPEYIEKEIDGLMETVEQKIKDLT